MNVHSVYVLYMAFELRDEYSFTDGKSTSWGLCTGSIRYQQLDPLRALDAENRRCARPRHRLRHPLLLPPPIPAPGRSSCVLPLAEFAYRPRAAPRSWFRLVTRFRLATPDPSPAVVATFCLTMERLVLSPVCGWVAGWLGRPRRVVLVAVKRIMDSPSPASSPERAPSSPSFRVGSYGVCVLLCAVRRPDCSLLNVSESCALALVLARNGCKISAAAGALHLLLLLRLAWETTRRSTF